MEIIKKYSVDCVAQNPRSWENGVAVFSLAKAYFLLKDAIAF
jgi:hypothetical protein